MTNKCRFVLLAIATTLAPGAFAGSSSATDWTLGVGGVYTWAGGSSPLIGSNIPTYTVTGDSTPIHNGATLSIVDGLLDLTSGAFTGTSTTWSWTGGGTLNLTGCIAGVTSATCTGSNDVTLISDDFTSVQVVPVLTLGKLSLDAVFGGVTGTINDSVAAYFGVPKAFTAGSFSSAIATVGSPGSPFVGKNLLGLIKADPPAVSMPEAWGLNENLALFALMLLAFGALIRLGALKSPFQTRRPSDFQKHNAVS